MKYIVFGQGIKVLLSLCLMHSFLLHADVEQDAQKKNLERVDWQAFSDGLDWNKYAEAILRKQEAVCRKHSKEIDDYTLAIRENEFLASIWLDNRSKVYESFAIADSKKYNDEGFQLRAVVLDHVVEGFAEKMIEVVNSSKKRILRTEKEMDEVVTQYNDFLTERDELQQVYNLILRHDVVRSDELKNGIDTMEESYLTAIDTRKIFIDSLHKLIDETEETIKTMKDETLLQSSVITASNGQIIQKS